MLEQLRTVLPRIDERVRAARARARSSDWAQRLRARAFALVSGAVLLFLAVATGAFPWAGAAVAWLALALAAATLSNAGDLQAPLSARASATASRAGGPAVWLTIVDAIPDVAIAFDTRGRVLHANARASDLYPDLRVGAALAGVMRHPALIEAADRIATSGGSASVEVEERVPIERRFQANLSVLEPDAAEGMPYMLLTLRDLTEQDRLADMRADFIANASHELRTPLASLRGFVETLQGAARDDAKARERFLGLMASQATRMTRLIDDLLSLSRIEMNAHIPPRGSVDLAEVAAYVVQTLQPLAEAESITLQLDAEVSPAMIRGERDEIVQVASNLLQNAIKYGRRGGHAKISVARDLSVPAAPRIILSVVDDGPGIAPEHLPRLTERFYRVSVQSSREKGGTGLGLAIVKHIVSRHRAELKITSRVGAGSTFSVIFPEQKNF